MEGKDQGEGFFRKSAKVIKSAASRTREELINAGPKIDFEDISAQSIAQIVDSQMKNSAREIVGKGARDNGFSWDRLLRNIHVRPNPDFPSSSNKGTQEVRIITALEELRDAGAVQADPNVEEINPSNVGELLFHVVDEAKLKDISTGKKDPEVELQDIASGKIPDPKA